MEKRRQRGNEIDTTGRTVASNVARLRRARDLSLELLSRSLGELGRPISVSGLSKLEHGDRKVDADDLVALAIALNVSPLAILLPPTRTPNEIAEVTGAKGLARDLWGWATGDTPREMDGDYEDILSQVSEFRSSSIPWWLSLKTEVPSDNLHPDAREREFKRLASLNEWFGFALAEEDDQHVERPQAPER